MGNSNSKADAARARLAAEQESHRESLANHEKTVAMLREMIADRDNNHQAEVIRMHAASNQRITRLEADREQMRQDYERNSAAREKATSEERERMRKEHNRMIEENERAAAKAREQQKEEERKLREKYEEEKKNIEAKLATEKDKRLGDEKAHSGKVEALHLEMREIAEAKNQEIRALQSNNEYLRIAGIVAQHQYAANSIAMLNNLAISNASAEDSARLNNEKQALLDAIAKLVLLRRKVVDWIIDVKIGKVSDADKTAQAILESMAEDTKSLGNMINVALSQIDKARFSGDCIEEVKKYLNIALDLADTLYTEVADVRVQIATTPVDGEEVKTPLAAVEKCLKDLRQAINSIPSKATPTMNERIQTEMDRVAIHTHQDIANLVNNAISSGNKPIPALKPP